MSDPGERRQHETQRGAQRPSQGHEPGAVRGRAAQHHPDPRQRADRGRRRPGQLPRDRPRHRGDRPGAGDGQPRRRDHGRRPHSARDRPQAAGRGDGRARRRRHRRPARRARRTLALQPCDAATRGLPDHGERRVPDQLRLPGPGAAAAVRQGQVRNLDRGDALLPERRLHARGHRARTVRCCAASPQTATGSPASTRRCRRSRGPAGRHRAAQDRRRAPQAPRRRRGDDRGLGQRDQDPLRDAGGDADLEGDRRHLPGLRAGDPARQHQAARGRRRRVRSGRGPGGDGLLGAAAR